MDEQKKEIGATGAIGLLAAVLGFGSMAFFVLSGFEASFSVESGYFVAGLTGAFLSRWHHKKKLVQYLRR